MSLEQNPRRNDEGTKPRSKEENLSQPSQSNGSVTHSLSSSFLSSNGRHDNIEADHHNRVVSDNDPFENQNQVGSVGADLHIQDDDDDDADDDNDHDDILSFSKTHFQNINNDHNRSIHGGNGGSSGNVRLYNPSVRPLSPSQREKARDAALQEAEMVLTALQRQRDPYNYYEKNNPQNGSMSHRFILDPRGKVRKNGESDVSVGESSTHDGVDSFGQDKMSNVSLTQSHLFLDSFNLLGVVTSPTLLLEHASMNASTSGSAAHPPRAPSISNGSSHAHAPSRDAVMHHAAASSGTSSTAGSSLANLWDPSFFSSVTSMSNTLSKEIESLNTTLSSYSKIYLGSMPVSSYYFSNDTAAGSLDFETELNSSASQIFRSTASGIYPYVFGEDIIKGQIPEDDLPKELVELDLSDVEAYLRKCGKIAEQLNLREDMTLLSLSDNKNGIHASRSEKSSERSRHKSDESDGGDAMNSVPDIFFSTDFDLTDPDVFSSLVVASKREEGVGKKIAKTNMDEKNQDELDDNRYQLSDKKEKLIQIQNPNDFTRYLDTVELALLHQVRSKSSSFFRETNRFTELKSLISSLVQEVQSLQKDLEKIRKNSVRDAEMIPIMDKRRKDTKLLKEVLDEVEHVVKVKSSIGEMIQNRNYLEAVERIYLARSLLNGVCAGKVGGENNRGKHVLKKVAALSKMHDQLAQYENLVVTDLSNELVDVFLSWNSTIRDDSIIPLSNSSVHSECPTTKIKNTILALKKCGKLSIISELYREKLSETIRVTVVTTISECAADAAKGTILVSTTSATIVTIPEKGRKGQTVVDEMSKPSIIEGVTSMSFDQFMECLDMIYENVLSILKSAASVNKFCLEEGISFRDDVNIDGRDHGDVSEKCSGSNNPSVLAVGADLSHRSVSELLRLRKDNHSLISFDEMRRLWDSCLAFTLQIERLSGQKAYVLRSTLLAQAKAFVERKHEANMSSLVATLDTERWIQCDVSEERQTALDRLCSGRAVSSNRDILAFGGDLTEKQPFAKVEGKSYRVVWSCLLLIEMIMNAIACAAHFQALAANIIGKVAELLRLFNSRSTQLVLGAGAIHSSARLKSINAKHLALVTQCVGVVQSILPHVRAALMTQLPSKQHNLLVDLDKIKKEYAEHHDKVLEKFVSIIGGIIEHGLKPKIVGTNFDQRGEEKEESNVECCSFLDGVITNTKKMHQVLHSLLPKEDLMDVFSRIFAHLDSKVPKLFLSMDSDTSVEFTLPESLEGKHRMILEMQTMANVLNSLDDVAPWDFGAMKFLGRRLEIESDCENDTSLAHDSHGNTDAEKLLLDDVPDDVKPTQITISNDDKISADTSMESDPKQSVQECESTTTNIEKNSNI